MSVKKELSVDVMIRAAAVCLLHFIRQKKCVPLSTTH